MYSKNWKLSLHGDRIVDENFDQIATVHQPGAGRILVSAPLLLDIVKEARRLLVGDEIDFLVKDRLIEKIDALGRYLSKSEEDVATRMLNLHVTSGLAEEAGQLPGQANDA